jgi:hypothetical protein
MHHACTKILAIAAAVAVIGGIGVTAASAGATAATFRRGTEHLTMMGASLTTTPISVIATGLFTDGGTIPDKAWAPGPTTSTITLGRGTIRLRETLVRHTDNLNTTTCLETASARGTYKLSHGTGRYAGISGSGRYIVTGRLVFGRTATGACATWRIIADQAILTLSGPALLPAH